MCACVCVLVRISVYRYLVVSFKTSFHWLRTQCILIDWCYNEVDTSYRMCSVLVLIESKFREWSINVDLISHWIAVKLSRTQTHYLPTVAFLFTRSLDICIALTNLRERDRNSKSTHTHTWNTFWCLLILHTTRLSHLVYVYKSIKIRKGPILCKVIQLEIYSSGDILIWRYTHLEIYSSHFLYIWTTAKKISWEEAILKE